MLKSRVWDVEILSNTPITNIKRYIVFQRVSTNQEISVEACGTIVK